MSAQGDWRQGKRILGEYWGIFLDTYLLWLGNVNYEINVFDFS